jgi:hypothetical protein
MARFILDTRLSNAHYVLCAEAIRRDVIEPEDLNEGRRTMPEQWHFWRNQPPPAAFPSPFAPHIKRGQPNHAIDADDGPVDRLAAFYSGQGVPVAFNVGGEPWHMDCLSGIKLVAAARRIRRERKARLDRLELHRGERSPEVKWIKHQLHYVHDPDTGKPYFRPTGSKPADGWDPIFNVDLETAVKRFQRDRKLKVDGVVGPTTERKIDAAYRRARKRRRKRGAEIRRRQEERRKR